MARGVAGVILAAVAVAAGCGSSGGSQTTGPPITVGTLTAAEKAAGRTLFAEHCGGCHVLAAAGTNGSVGPNLDQVRPPEISVVEQIRQGGGGMPAFQGTLTREQIREVAGFVLSARH